MNLRGLTLLSRSKRLVASRGWLADQPTSFAEALLASAELTTRKQGELLYGLDDPPGGLDALTDGFVDVIVGPLPSTPKLIHVAGPVLWMGETALITGSGRQAQIRARTDATFLRIRRQTILKIADNDPTVWRYVSAIAAGHLLSAFQTIAGLSEPDHRVRLATTLWRMAHQAGTGTKPVWLPLTQLDLSEMACVSTSSVGRMLAEFEAQGILEVGYRRITVLDLERLRQRLV